MKRCQHVRLLLLGGAIAAAPALASDSSPPPPRLSAGKVYPNDNFRPGVGYFHAAYRDWFPFRYNHYDAEKKLYYHGGQWTAEPHRSIVNLAEPLAERQGHASRVTPVPYPVGPHHSSGFAAQPSSQVKRSGFGSSSRSSSS